MFLLLSIAGLFDSSLVYMQRARGEIQQLPWTSDEVHPIHDSSIFLRPNQTL
jgi:hypothetical protein